MRNLAQRSASAARDTADLLEDSVVKTDNGARLSAKCGEALQDIVKNVKKATDLTKEIKNASVEQSDGIGQVNTAVQQMDTVTQENTANAEETASASEEMLAQTENLMDQIRILAALVGGTGSITGDKEPIKKTSIQDDMRDKKNVDSDVISPIGENRITEHENSFKNS